MRRYEVSELLFLECPSQLSVFGCLLFQPPHSSFELGLNPAGHSSIW